MRRLPRRPGDHHPGQSGQSLVEFAITLPMLVILMLGAWSVSHAAYDAEIVKEATYEGGKMAGIDRLRADHQDAYQMTDDEVVSWMNAAAHEADGTIGWTAIKFVGNRNSNQGFQFDGSADQLNDSPNHPSNEIFGSLTSLFSGGSFADKLNPELKTATMEYDFDSGVGPGWTYPIRYKFDFQGYMMVWIPFGKGAP